MFIPPVSNAVYGRDKQTCLQILLVKNLSYKKNTCSIMSLLRIEKEQYLSLHTEVV